MTSPNFMVIGLQIRKLHRGAESAPPAVLDSKKPGLFRVKLGKSCTLSVEVTNMSKSDIGLQGRTVLDNQICNTS